MNNSVIVVEGIHDEARLKQINPNFLTLSVGGLQINKEKLKLLKQLSKKHDIILFLDADYPGMKIRKMIEKEIPGAYHAYLRQSDSRGRGGKIGVEHASDEVILNALSKRINISSNSNNNHNNQIWNQSILYKLELTGYKNSRKLREKITNYFSLGYSNAKQLIFKLNALNISITDVEEVLNESSI